MLKNWVCLVLLAAITLTGCTRTAPTRSTPAPDTGVKSEAPLSPVAVADQFPFRPADLSKVDRVVIRHTISQQQVEWTGDQALRLARALTQSPATPTGGKMPACATELELQLFAGAEKVADAMADPTSCLIVIIFENATRTANAETAALLESIAARLRPRTAAAIAPEERVAIARQLFADHLAKSKGPDVPTRSRLLDYRIDSLSVYPAVSDGRELVLVQYSVLPATRESAWMAGNGQDGENGWIVDKVVFLDLVQQDGVWRIKQMSTSP